MMEKSPKSEGQRMQSLLSMLQIFLWKWTRKKGKEYNLLKCYDRKSAPPNQRISRQENVIGYCATQFKFLDFHRIYVADIFLLKESRFQNAKLYNISFGRELNRQLHNIDFAETYPESLNNNLSKNVEIYKVPKE